MYIYSGLEKGRLFLLSSQLRTRQDDLFHHGSDLFNTNVPDVPIVKITDLQFSDINRIGHRVREGAINLAAQSVLCREDLIHTGLLGSFS